MHPLEALPRLGVNIDHVATLRQLRGTPYPDLIAVARMVEDAGADQITAHLREDRRHINDADMKHLRAKLRVPLNMEMGATPEMVRIACRLKPDWACLVPEKRQELTTEGGLNLEKNKRGISFAIRALKRAGIRVSAFVEPTETAVALSSELGADAIELHTGRFCLAAQQGKVARLKAELKRISASALLARELGIGAHAGHGFDLDNVRPIAALQDGRGAPLIEEYNIGHSIVCRAVVVGIVQAVREMKSSIHAP